MKSAFRFLVLGVLSLSILWGFQSNQALAHDIDLVDEHDYVFVDNVNFTGIFIVLRDDDNPTAGWSSSDSAVLREDGTVAATEFQIPREPGGGCLVDSNGNCDPDVTLYSDIAGSVIIYVQNGTNRAEIYVALLGEIFDITLVGETDGNVRPDIEDPETDGSVLLRLTILNLDDLLGFGPVGPLELRIFNSDGERVATEEIDQITESVPGNFVSTGFDLPEGDDYTIQVYDGDTNLGETDSFDVNAGQASDVELSINVQNQVDLMQAEEEEPEPSCESTVVSLGWVLCPVASFALDGLENIVQDGVVRTILNFDALDGESNQRAALQSIWGGFRAIANVGFVIVFMVVVYSAASGGVLSAYDVRKLLPKLLAGAVMVQLSFFICTQLVVIFNAMGDSVTSIMLSPIGIDTSGGAVNSLFNGNEIGWGILGEAIQGVVSTLILILIIIGALFSIVGIMIMVLVFVVRNIALMVMTVISPLAFVAWILPNTEGLFKKWWGNYIQLLALFPIAMAFLSSGRLVSYIWTQGDGGWANQWIGMIALFAPYIVAPKLFSFAGSAIGGIVRGIDNAKSGIKARTGQLRQTSVGKRAEAGAKARVASRINSRYGVGGSNAGGIRGKIAQTGMVQRSTARAQQAKNAIKLEDIRAARVNVDANRSNARLDFQSMLRDDEGNLVDESGAKLPPGSQGVRSGPTLRGDAAEVEYLTQVLESGSSTMEEQTAAIDALLNVHGTKGEAVMAVHRFMTGPGGLEERIDSDPEANQMYNRIVGESGGAATAIPQLLYGNDAGTVGRLDATEVHGLKGGSVDAFMQNKEAGDALVRRTVDAVASGSTEGQLVRSANVAVMYNQGDAEQRAALEEHFDIEISPLNAGDTGAQQIMNADGSPALDGDGNPRYGKVRTDKEGNEMKDSSGNYVFEYRVLGKKRGGGGGSADPPTPTDTEPPLPPDDRTDAGYL